MIKLLEKRLALSHQGAKDFVKGVLFTTLLDIALMFPAIYIYLFLEDYLLPIIIPHNASLTDSVWYYLIMGLGFLLIMYAVALLQYKGTFLAVYDESAVRRISLAEKLRKLPLAFFAEKNLSDLTSTIMEDNTDLEHTFSHAVPQLFASIISIMLIAVGLFFYNWQLALALFWVIPLAALVVLSAKRLLRKENTALYQKKRVVSEHIQEGLETIQEIKSYCQEESYLANLASKLKGCEKQLIRGELLAGGLVNSAQGIIKLGLASVIIVGASLLADGSIDLFTYLIFLLIASRIYSPINEVFNNLAALFYLDVRIRRMNEMAALPAQQGTTNFSPEHYDIEFKKVDFAYEEGKTVLKDVSFIAKQGEITALIGPSGGGKSTATKLAARFWDVDHGEISLGNQDIRLIDPETLLQYYAVVFQDVVLFNTSIIDNIRIGRRNASDEEVLHVARLARCDDFVTEMPQGYETIIGENGETLSGGERQRISIARALLKDAPIVLLDEATASLDVENETLIQRALSELIRDKTVIVIAHRMRTIANADQVIVLNNGTVAESGTPTELKSLDGIYSKMMKRQMQELSSDYSTSFIS